MGYLSYQSNPKYFSLISATFRPLVTWVLLGINVVLWLALNISGAPDDPNVLLRFGAMFGPLVAKGEYWRLFSAMFLHVGLMHLIFNGFSLIIFGRIVESIYGKFQFLSLYILAGLFGSAFSYMLNSIAIGIGASGAIFGVIGALVTFFFTQSRNTGRMLKGNLYGILMLAGINLFYGLITPGIDNWAHIGGFIAGVSLGFFLTPRFQSPNLIFCSACGEKSNVGAEFCSGCGIKLDFGRKDAETKTSLITKGLIDEIFLPKRIWFLFCILVILGGVVFLGTLKLPENPYTHFYFAEEYFNQLEYEKTLLEIDKALAIDSSFSQAYLLKAKVFIDLGDLSAAETEIGRALKFALVKGNKKIIEEAINLSNQTRVRQN